MPVIDPSAWVAPGALCVGSVTVGAQSSVWYASVLRGDEDSITIGVGSNVQDGSVLHADPDLPVVVGDDVSVGHRVVLHGCTIGDGCLIGMGAVVLNGASVGAGSLVAAGTVVLEGADIPPNSLVAGVPGKVRRETTPEEREGFLRNAATYRGLTDKHRSADG